MGRIDSTVILDPQLFFSPVLRRGDIACCRQAVICGIRRGGDIRWGGGGGYVVPERIPSHKTCIQKCQHSEYNMGGGGQIHI